MNIFAQLLEQLLDRGFGSAEADVGAKEVVKTVTLHVVVTHLVSNGYHSKSLLRLIVPVNNAPVVTQMLTGVTGLGRSGYHGVLADLRRLGELEDLGFKGYKQGMSDANPDWLKLGFWTNQE